MCFILRVTKLSGDLPSFLFIITSTPHREHEVVNKDLLLPLLTQLHKQQDERQGGGGHSCHHQGLRVSAHYGQCHARVSKCVSRLQYHMTNIIIKLQDTFIIVLIGSSPRKLFPKGSHQRTNYGSLDIVQNPNYPPPPKEVFTLRLGSDPRGQPEPEFRYLAGISALVDKKPEWCFENLVPIFSLIRLINLPLLT